MPMVGPGVGEKEASEDSEVLKQEMLRDQLWVTGQIKIIRNSCASTGHRNRHFWDIVQRWRRTLLSTGNRNPGWGKEGAVLLLEQLQLKRGTQRSSINCNPKGSGTLSE